MSSPRFGTALVLAWMLCGCYRSAISLAPAEDLTAVPELADGVYCAAAADWSGQVRLDPDDCRRLAWEGERKVYVETRDWENADWSVEHRIVRLADGLYLTEVDEPGREAFPYTVAPFFAAEDGFAAVGDVGRDGFGAFAEAYQDVATAPPDRFGAGDILSGDLGRARVMLELAARSDTAVWLAGEGDREALVVYVRVEEGDGPAAAAARHAGVVDALRSRVVTLRR